MPICRIQPKGRGPKVDSRRAMLTAFSLFTMKSWIQESKGLTEAGGKLNTELRTKKNPMALTKVTRTPFMKIF